MQALLTLLAASLASLPVQSPQTSPEKATAPSPTIDAKAAAGATPRATAGLAEDLGALRLRRLGPGVMGGRITDLAVDERRPATFYVATASGGLWRTTNMGTTFEPLFQDQAVVSLGAVALAQSDPEQVWVGTGEANNRNSTSWGNGVYKSEDGGKTWRHVGLDTSRHVARIAVHPRDPDTVYVAACGSLWGEGGDRGLFRTRDGGRSWERVLSANARTGATEVRIDPVQPDVVYAALYERIRDGYDTNAPLVRWGKGSGLYRSTDGGDSWTRLTNGLPTVELGRIALDIHRSDPRTLFALVESAWIGQRPPGAPPQERPDEPAYFGVQGMADGDGGVVLQQIVSDSPAAKAGLRDRDLLLSMGKAQILTADDLRRELGKRKAGEKAELKVIRGGDFVVTTIELGTNPTTQRNRGRGGFADRLHGQNANVQAQQGPRGFETGGVFRSDDRGETWTRVNSLNPRPYYFSQIRVDPLDPTHVFVLGVSLHRSDDGGKSFKVIGRMVHPDHHAMWIDPRDPRHNILGCDGGVAVSWDRGDDYEVFDNLDIGQAYHAVADSRRPYWVYAGYQDNGSWGGPSRTNLREGITSDHYFKIGGGDGFVCLVDPDDPDLVYYESQNGNIGWIDVMTNRRGRVNRPRSERDQRQVRPQGARREASGDAPEAGTEAAAGGDQEKEAADEKEAGEEGGEGGEAKDEAGEEAAAEQGGGQERDAGTNEAVPEWKDDQREQRGRYRYNWNTPFLLSRFDPRVVYSAGNYVCKAVDHGRHAVEISPDLAFTPMGCATALAESPRHPGELWVGTNEGGLWYTRDEGRTWTAVHGALASQHPACSKAEGRAMWVSSICVSGHTDGRVYVTLDGHRLDDMRPYVFVTEDRGETWKALDAGLPEESVHVLLEDDANADLLYLGTEMGPYVSVDRGASWTRLPKPFPTVAVRDFDIQTREQHLILATHGRSLWCLDVRPLRALDAKAREAGLLLVQPADVLRLPMRSAGLLGHRHATIPNPPAVAGLYWWLDRDHEGEAQLEVLSAEGKVLWSSKAKATAGLHGTDWNLRLEAPARRGQQERAGRPVPAGSYVARLRVGATTQSRVFRVEDDDRPLDTAQPRPKGVGEAGPPVLGPLDPGQGLGGDEDEEGDQEQAGGAGASGASGKEVEIR